MATYEVSGLPNSYQTEYARIPRSLLPGDVVEGELFNERAAPALLARVNELAFAGTVTIGAFNPGDQVGINVNGVTVPVTATTDADATALLLVAAINGSSLLSGKLSAVAAGGPVINLAGVVGVDLTITEYSPDATTATVNVTQASVVQPLVCYGYGVARDIPSATVHYSKIKRPSALSDQFAGVLIRTEGSNIPTMMIAATLPNFDSRYLLPGQCYAVLRENAVVAVEFVGTAPTESDSVYWVCTGNDAGKWSASDGSVAGTSEVVTLTLTTTATDTVAFNYDGLPDLTIASATGTEVTDAANLYAQWIANAAYAALGSIVDNLDGTLTITFADDTTHTFTDNSGGTSSIAEGVDTPAVAAIPATAQLRPDYSWARPSILASADVPARAFLRLSNP